MRRLRLLALFVLPLVARAAGGAGGAGNAVPRAEYDVKAEFILRIAQFVEWPAAPAAGTGAFTLCIIGENPFGDHLRNHARNATLHGQPASVRTATETTLDGCQVLFIGADRARELERLLALTASRGILTISDSPGFCRRGVMVNFYLESGRIRFEASPAAFQKGGLHAGARLLQLARLVE